MVDPLNETTEKINAQIAGWNGY